MLKKPFDGERDKRTITYCGGGIAASAGELVGDALFRSGNCARLGRGQAWCRRRLPGRYNFVLAGQKQVYDRYDEQGENSAETHAADDDPADLVAGFCTCAGCERERYGAEHHCASGHQDRP